MSAFYLIAETEAQSFDLVTIWNDIVTFFTTKYWNIIAFFAVFIIGLIVRKLLVLLTRRVLNRSKMEKIAQNFIFSIVRFLLSLVLVLVMLSVIGINVNGIITAISAAILAVGMALQNNLANLASGIIIVSMHMIAKGDFITSGDISGTVDNINFFFTTVNSTDNKRISIPNSNIVNSSLTNYGVNGTRRVDFTFSVAYESDVETVKQTVQAVFASYNKIKQTPAPFCRLKTLNASSIDFFANCWCNSADYWDVYYYVTENVFNEFKRRGISLPFNQTEVRIRKDEVKMPGTGDGLPEREADTEEPAAKESGFKKRLNEIKSMLDEEDD